MALESLAPDRVSVFFLDQWRNAVSMETANKRTVEGAKRLALLKSMAAALPASGCPGTLPEPRACMQDVLDEMRDTMLRHCLETEGRGILSSAFKAAYLRLQGKELQLEFDGTRFKIKDLMELCRDTVEIATVNTQACYRFRGGLKKAMAVMAHKLEASKPAAASAPAGAGAGAGAGTASSPSPSPSPSL
jgi:hypothetical protein